MSTTVTTGMVREIRQRKADGQKLKEIAAAMGLHIQTVWKYSTEENTATAKRTEQNTKARIRADPVRLAKRRAEALAYAHRVRGRTS